VRSGGGVLCHALPVVALSEEGAVHFVFSRGALHEVRDQLFCRLDSITLLGCVWPAEYV
jgi:hypothetical protein